MHRIISLLSVILLMVSIIRTTERRIRYIATERPHTDFNPKYLSFVNLSSRRFGRQNPLYYVDMHFIALYSFGNNASFHFSFYKDLPNRHQRLMMEIRRGLCDLLVNDRYFGSAMRQGKFLEKCPFKAGDYHLYNMTIPFEAIPLNFPHFSGKIVLNVTKAGTKEFIAGGWVEMEVKTMKIGSSRSKLTSKPFDIL